MSKVNVNGLRQPRRVTPADSGVAGDGHHVRVRVLVNPYDLVDGVLPKALRGRNDAPLELAPFRAEGEGKVASPAQLRVFSLLGPLEVLQHPSREWSNAWITPSREVYRLL